MIQLLIQVTGLLKAVNQLNSFAANIQDWGGYWDEVEEYLDDRELELFSSGGSSHGVRWEPLSPTYARRKALDGFGHQPLLVRTGAMRAGLLGVGVSSQFTIRKKSRRAFTWGSSDPLVAIHNQGLGRNLPVRSIIVLTKEDIGVLTRKARDFINKKAVEAGMTAIGFGRS